MATPAMTYDACFLFRGDVRYDTRLSNMVQTFVRAGRSCLIIQGASRDERFETHGARVESFENTKRGPSGFLEYWRKSRTRANRVHAKTWWAAELYSLPVVVRRARITAGRSVYDAREIFAHLGDLHDRPMTQMFWRWLERRYIHRSDAVVTTGAMDRDFLKDCYHITPPFVVRNLPRYREVARNFRLYDALGIPRSMPICLYSGGLQDGRGIRTMLSMASQIPGAAFVLLGSGPLEDRVRQSMHSCSNIYHHPAVPNEQVIDFAASAAVGFALIEPISLSYRYALPNKLFEYIMAGTPVLVTNLPQMKKIVDQYGVGLTVSPGSLPGAVQQARHLLSDSALHRQCAANCHIAAQDLCWDREEESFLPFARATGIL